MSSTVINKQTLDLAFRRSEQKVSANLLKFKNVVRNAYYGKIPDGGSFPLESGTSIKGVRLGRVGVPTNGGWRPISDGLCETNAGTLEGTEVISHGNSEFIYSIVQRDMRTDWINLSSTRFRSNPREEIQHLEEGLQYAARYVHEEFRRTRYHDFCRNKMVGILPLDNSNNVRETYNSSQGVDMINSGYVWETRENGEMDENYIRVRFDLSAANADWRQISELTLDMLDRAHARLQYADQSFLDGTNLYDTVLADQSVSNRMAEIELLKVGADQANVGGYNMLDLSKAYGTERVLRNRFSTRTDIFSARFYPDDAFNTALFASAGYAFDDNDAATWPRLKRVYAFYTKRSSVGGVESVENPDYLNAPFGLSTILIPEVMEVQSLAEPSNMGGATMGASTRNDGTARWVNPDWKENVLREKGFWIMQFEMAAKQNYDDRGYSYLHRIGNGVLLSSSTNELPGFTPRTDASPYCYEGIIGNDVGVGGNSATGYPHQN